MKRLIIVAVAAAIGLVLLSACSDDPEPTTTVAPTASADQGSTAATATVVSEAEPTATEAATPEPTVAPEPQPTATTVPTPEPTAAPEPQATATTVPTPEPTAAPEPQATATAPPTSDEGSGESVTFALNELNGSGQTGTATLTAIGDTTVVSLTLSTGALDTELVHIHSGQCGDTLAGVVHPLAKFVDGSGASLTTVDATLDSLLTGGFAVNSHQSGNPGTYTACGNIPAKGQTVSIALDELNGSGQTGTATLTAIGDTTVVSLTLSSGTLETQLVHIHAGQCGDTLAGVAHPLASFVDGSGASLTTVDATLDSLLTGGFAVNSHQSGNPGTYTACGNIPAKGQPVSIALDELNGSGQTGTATLTAIGDTTVVSLTLSTGTLETQLVHIHTGQCGDTLAGVVHPLAKFVNGSGASLTTVNATLDSLLTGGFAVNSHQSGNPGTYTACGNIPAKGQTVSIALDELNGSGQSGTAILTAIGDTTVVSLTLSTGTLETQLVHIHTGQCGDTLSGVAHPLAKFVDGSGSSVTTVDATLGSLLTGGFAVNSHQSGNPGTYTACGNIPAKGQPVTIALDELNGSGQSGTAILTAIGDTTVVSLTLSTGTLETQLVHIHTGQCGDTLAGVVHPLAKFVDGSGASLTTVDATLGSLLTGGFAVNSHQSGNPGTYTACGNIPGPTQVSIQQFRHQDVVIALGTTIRWTNLDPSTHTVTLGSNGIRADGFDSGFVRSGATFEFTFDTPGTFAYTCTIHPSMNATIQVGEAIPLAAGSPLYNLF